MKMNSDQIESLEQDRLRRFAAEMLEYSRSRHPSSLDGLGETEAAALVRGRVEDARARGFRLRGHVKRYLDLGFVLGAPPHEIDWAAPIAEDADMEAAARLHRLERTAAFAARGG